MNALPIFVDLDSILAKVGNFDDVALGDVPPTKRFAVELDARMTFEVDAKTEEEAIALLLTAFNPKVSNDPLGYTSFRIDGANKASAQLMTTIIQPEAGGDDAAVWEV